MPRQLRVAACVSCRRGAGQGRQSRVGIAARAQSWAAGQADAMAILMRRRSLICFASGVHTTLLGSCLAACARAPGRSEGAFRAGVIVQPATRLPACSHVDVSGISQVPRRSILCLCLGPRPRPNRRSLAYCRFHRCYPRSDDSEGFSVMGISGLSRGFSTCCLRFKNGVATIHARLASGWLARLYREGVEPSGSR